MISSGQTAFPCWYKPLNRKVIDGQIKDIRSTSLHGSVCQKNLEPYRLRSSTIGQLRPNHIILMFSFYIALFPRDNLLASFLFKCALQFKTPPPPFRNSLQFRTSHQ